MLIGIIGVIAYGTFWFLCYLGLDFRERTVAGKNVNQWLQMLRANTNATDNPLKITDIHFVREANYFYVKVPLAYDSLMKHDFFEGNNRLKLVVNGKRTGYLQFISDTDGSCILLLSPDNLLPGTNQIQADFFMSNPNAMEHWLEMDGPITEYFSSNICEIIYFTSLDESRRLILHGNLAVTNANYSIELQDTNGVHLNTMVGRTTNRFIDERWNLLDDSGNIYSHPIVNAIYQVTVPGFTTQTLEQKYRIEAK